MRIYETMRLTGPDFFIHCGDNIYAEKNIADGPQLIFQFQKASPSPNLAPLFGLQFFGQVYIDSESKVMTVALKDIDGDTLFMQEIYPF